MTHSIPVEDVAATISSRVLSLLIRHIGKTLTPDLIETIHLDVKQNAAELAALHNCDSPA